MSTIDTDSPASIYWRPWREVAIVSMMVMELCWIVPWFRSLTPATYWVSPVRVFIVLGAILAIAHLLVRLTNFVNLRLDLRRMLLIAYLIGAVLFGIKTLLIDYRTLDFGALVSQPLFAFGDWANLIPDEFLVALFALLASWRGVSLAQAFIEPVTVRRYFYHGIALFVGFIFINTFVTGETPGFSMYIFFLAALIAMGAARISVISTLRGGYVIPFDRRWFIGIILATSLVVGFASVISWLVSERFDIFERIGGIVVGITALLLVSAISPVIFLVQYAIQSSEITTGGLAYALQGFVLGLENLRTIAMDLAKNIFGVLVGSGLISWIPKFKPVVLWGLLLMAAIAILAGLSQILFKDFRRGGDKNMVISGVDLMDLIREAIQNRLRKLREDLSTAARYRPGSRYLGAAKIRKIYSELMNLAESLGRPRPPAITPLEYLPTLGEVFPGLEMELATITEAYLRVRYGEFPENRQEILDVEIAWGQVHAQGKKMLQQRSI